MPSNNDAEIAASDFVEKASEECLSCEKFGTSYCPAFQKAVTEQKIPATILASKIKNAQEGKSLMECSKA